MPTSKVLTYRRERDAKAALTRLHKRYPDAWSRFKTIEIVWSTEYLYPFRYLIKLTTLGGHSCYWSK